MQNITIFFLLLTCFFGCTNVHTDYDAMAKDLCNCMRPLAEINQEIKKRIAEGQTNEIADLLTKVEQLSIEGESCAGALEDKYGEIKGEAETEATAALKRHCPDIAEMLEQSASLEQ